MERLYSKQEIENKVLHGDVNKVLREFPDNIIDTCIVKKDLNMEDTNFLYR